MFAKPEAAQRFSERVAERVQRQRQPGVKRDKEILGEEVAEEFAQAGETVASINNRPWEHTPEEHAEVQQLVNTAFAQDLGRALQQAKASPHYPRNLDLLHDLLTTEMYEHLREAKINRQPTALWLMGISIVTLLTLAAILLVFLL